MNLNTVLLVEDDKLFRQMLRDELERHDFLVLEAVAGKRSVQILQQQTVDIILLDLHLLDGNGLDFIPDIRKHSNAPLIIISGDDETAGKIEGLKKGADDYVEKPFDMDELVARIMANLRREQNMSSNQNQNAEESISRRIHFGTWVLDQEKFQIFDEHHNPADLTIKEFQLLEKLISTRGKAVSREDLCEAIREENYIPTKRAIDVKITRIRKKIGDDAHAPTIIKTVRGVGYMIHCETEKAA